MESDLRYECMRDINFEMLPDSLKEWMKIPQHEQRSDEWFAQRKDRLTASNIDSILGRNTYANREEILFKKNEMSVPFQGNVATEHGCVHENNCIEEYCRIYNKKMIEFGLINHPEIEFLAGSPDGIVFDNNDKNSKPYVIEVKCPYKRVIYPGIIPVMYESQILLNMEIFKYDGIFLEYVPDGHFGQNKMLNITHLKYDPAWFKETLPILKEFWDEVVHYRNVGINTHPNYDKWERKIRPKRIVDFTTNTIKECPFVSDTEYSEDSEDELN